jgi:predicted PurR-regulated permease PerM
LQWPRGPVFDVVWYQYPETGLHGAIRTGKPAAHQLRWLRTMLGIDPKAARATWTVFLVALAIAVLYLARHTIIILVLALFFAYLLSPALGLVERLLPPRISRPLGLATVYLAFLAALVGIGFAIGSAITEQATSLATKLPEVVKSQDPLAALPLPAWLLPLRERLTEMIRSQVADLNEQAFPLIKRAVEEVAARAGRFVQVILIPILAFFFLKDGTAIRQAIISWTTSGKNSVILDEIFEDVHILLGHYIRALVILAAATFVSYTLFLQATGGQYAVLLGGVAGVLEFIPVVGPLTASIIIILVEGMTGYGHVWSLLIFLILYRLFQDYVLSPYLMGAGVELHPLLVLAGVLAGEQIGGIPGMFFSVPVIATLRVVYVRLQKSRTRITAPAEESP